MDEKTIQACEWNTAHEEQCDLREAIVELSNHEWAIHPLLTSFAAARAERVETPEDTAAHIQAMKEYKAGETIAFEDINWN